MRDGFAKLKIDWRKKSDEKIQSLEKIVKELSKQVKQQALYQERILKNLSLLFVNKKKLFLN